jgi:hypothetical protein
VNQPVVTTPPPTSPPPETAYSVVVKTVDTQGQPISSVAVNLYVESVGTHAIRTGSDGTATFDFSARSAKAYVETYLAGYYSAGRQIPLAGANSPIVQQLTLMRTEEAQLVLNGVTSETSADASSVVVNADIGASDRNGNPIATLTAADFTVPELECFFGHGVCLLDPSGAPLSNGYWVPSQRDPSQVTLRGAGPSILYRVRYVLEAEPGMFTAGRTVLTWVYVRVGDSLLTIPTHVRL